MSIQSFTFTSDVGGFDGYQALYASGTDVSATDAPFAARVEAYRFGRMNVFERVLSGVEHRRNWARVRNDGFEHFTLQYLRNGVFHGGPLGDERRLSPGDIILFDLTRPQRTRLEMANFVTVSLPRELIEAAAPDAGRFHGQILPEAVSGLLGDLMGSLARRAAATTPETATSTARALSELLAGALGQMQPSEEATSAILTDLRRQRAEAFIEARLHDPSLDVAMVARGAGVSRSALYRLFEPTGGVAHHITTRRLERLSAALRNPAEMRSITTLTFDHGFSSESHCSRVFRSAFGVPPGRYRAEIRRPGADERGGPLAGESARSLLDAWSRALA
ncbi:helix-turn-helix domain-containing protein [Methylorubrum populi]